MSVLTRALISSVIAAGTAVFGLAQNVPEMAFPPPPPPVAIASLAQGEAAVAANPEDLEARANLVLFCWRHNEMHPWQEQVIWMVQHHPNSPLLSREGFTLPPRDSAVIPESSSLQLVDLWRQQIAHYPDDAFVLGNAGFAFTERDPYEADRLLQRAMRLEPRNIRPRNTRITLFTSALLNRGQWFTFNGQYVAPSPAFQQYVRSELESTSDTELVGGVAERLLSKSRAVQGRPTTGSVSVSSKPIAILGQEPAAYAETLLNRLKTMQPDNARWQRDLDRLADYRAGKTPASPLPTEPADTTSFQMRAGAVNVVAQVAQANLVHMVEPVYPPLARQARVQGTVTFAIVIDEKGSVGSVRLVKGHPLLVNAAKEAVEQYVYKPTLLNGKPVSMVTEVEVSFAL